MFYFAFFLLAGYSFYLLYLNNRHIPTVFDAAQDFFRLACAVFGLLSAGIVHWVLPLNVMAYWGYYSYVIWVVGYFAVAHLIAICLPPRIIVYGCSRTAFVETLLAEWSNAGYHGNVLTVPERGIQCTITEHLGRCTVLCPTELAVNKKTWGLFVSALQTALRQHSTGSKAVPETSEPLAS